MVRNKALVLRQNPVGCPVPGDDLAVVVGSFSLLQAPPPGGLIVKTIYASLDPYHRICMSETYDVENSLFKPMQVGKPLTSLSIAEVVRSSDKRYKRGDMITGLLAIQEYSIIRKDWIDYYAPIVTSYDIELPIFLSTLGMIGLTASACLYCLVKPEEYETIFISSAAGGVGQLVGQLAIEEGLTVIGSVGTDEKLDYIVSELEFDHGFNYKIHEPLDALRLLAPDGIDIYFDNVGGKQLDAALQVMKENGRIICCGMISDYNKSLEEKYGLKHLINVASRELTIHGFLATNCAESVYTNYFAIAERFASGLSSGLYDARYWLVHGIEFAPEGFVSMMKGEFIGKSILKI